MKITPKKRLGQNFLKDQGILAKIIKAADLKADDLVIEIGSGHGILTEELVRHAGKVVAIEIDNDLAKKLDSRFRGNDKIEIINDDILKINLPELIIRHSSLRQSEVKNLPPSCNSKKILRSALGGTQDDGTDYKVVANIPYYITSHIIQLFLETEFPPREMILMVQKEVAERICARAGNMSILAVSVQYYAKPELLFYVPKTAFWPVPEVDSAVIRITPFSSQNPSSILPLEGGGGNAENKKFFRVVKAGFCAKRKLLSNNLSSSFHLDKKEVEEKIKKVGVNPGSRAQELSVEEWKELVKLF
jgi:16S rRNA (adenine1518-N6/adenine1519-N6)-dimethyltransferase